jgi:hypothetical protein
MGGEIRNARCVTGEEAVFFLNFVSMERTGRTER